MAGHLSLAFISTLNDNWWNRDKGTEIFLCSKINPEQARWFSQQTASIQRWCESSRMWILRKSLFCLSQRSILSSCLLGKGYDAVGFSTFSREFPNLDFYENSTLSAPSIHSLIHSFNIYLVTTRSCSKLKGTAENKTGKTPTSGHFQSDREDK